MLPATYRRLFARKSLAVALVVLFLLYIGRMQLPKLQYNRSSSPGAVFFKRPTMQLEQNGDYWIYNNFMRPMLPELKGNMSLTLTTYGTYRDFKNMKWLLARWSAPISLAVYVDQDDFEQTLQTLYHIKYCTIFGMSWSHWISMQLVFHDKHFPLIFEHLNSELPLGWRCRRSKGNKSTRVKQPKYIPNYPVNLLRNVARLNARTFFVLPLDPGMLPTQHFVRNFLQFAHLYSSRLSLKCIYCIPIFPQLSDDSKLPKYKSELITQLEPYLNGTFELRSPQADQLDELAPWLSTSVQDGDMLIFDISKDPHYCGAHVSSNAYEPLYDQRYNDSSYETHSSRLQVLVGLGFDFVLLDGTFIIHRSTEASIGAPRSYSPKKLKHIGELIKLNSLALSIPIWVQ